MRQLINQYRTDRGFDEMFEATNRPRPHYRQLIDRLQNLTPQDFDLKQRQADQAFLRQGITFTVYGDAQQTERVFPFDLLPRIIPNSEWQMIEAGLRQRIQALNQFLLDIYGPQQIFRDHPILRRLVETSKHFHPDFKGFRPPKDIFLHIAGIDLVRDQEGIYRVLEDNIRTPSGISYVLENRMVMKQTFPNLFAEMQVRPVDHYPTQLWENLRFLANESRENPTIVLLTPGIYNSAYFEHSFLSLQMGIELVEGRDLVVEADRVYMKTTQGLQQVDVIYRRVDDDFLDPEVFRNDSALGVPGLMRAYRAGNVSLANGVGTGVADDKAIYSFVPTMIEYYLTERPILPNVQTYLCDNDTDRKFVFDHMPELVIKSVNESGGYGMLIGSSSTKAEQEEFQKRITHSPRDYVAQPIIPLSSHPCAISDVHGNIAMGGRHVDLRPFVLWGPEVSVSLGGLTRVALEEGSLVVNSSQGGGSKDTWVLYGEG